MNTEENWSPGSLLTYDGMLRPYVKHTVASTQKVNECFTPIKMGEDLNLVEQP